MLKRSTKWLGLSLLVVTTVWAAPPRDLSDFSKESALEGDAPARPRPRTLKFKEDQITAGEAPARSSAQRRVKFDVVCRDQPGRNGKGKVRLKAKSIVLIDASKKDAAWSAVTYAPAQAACWIPKSAIQ